MNKIKLGEICEVSKGSQLNKIDMMNSGKYYVQNGGIDISGYTDNYNTDENTISISEGGNSCGYVNFNNEKFWAGGHCYRLLNLRNDVDVKYLYQLLKYKQSDIMKLRVGSGLPNIQKKDIKKLEIYLPELKLQRKISILLDSIDKIIKNYELLMKEKEQFVKSQFVEMFGKEKETISLNEISKRITDGSHNPPKGENDDTGYYMLSSQNIENGKIIYTDSRNLKKSDFEKENRRTMVTKGDILFSIVGTIGKTAVFQDDKKVTFQRSVAILKIKNNINKQFLIYSLLSNEVKKQLHILSKGGAQEGLYLEDLKNIKIKNVIQEKQNQFSRIVKLIDKQKFNYINKIKLLKEIINIFLGGKKI